MVQAFLAEVKTSSIIGLFEGKKGGGFQKVCVCMAEMGGTMVNGLRCGW